MALCGYSFTEVVLPSSSTLLVMCPRCDATRTLIQRKGTGTTYMVYPGHNPCTTGGRATKYWQQQIDGKWQIKEGNNQ